MILYPEKGVPFFHWVHDAYTGSCIKSDHVCTAQTTVSQLSDWKRLDDVNGGVSDTDEQQLFIIARFSATRLS